MKDLLAERRAGVLLHITSLPNEHGQGDLGEQAYNFVNFLRDTGIKVWQTLPLGVTHGDKSPYQCLSAHAGNPDFISRDSLKALGWLDEGDFCEKCQGNTCFQKTCLLSNVFARFNRLATDKEQHEFLKFCKDKAEWLDDYALFIALRMEFSLQCWNQWPSALKNREQQAIKEAKQRLANDINCIKFQQFIFYKQWIELKNYANENNVLLFGDIPIFVSYDSADVWVNREVFKLDTHGEMLVVAGVPPDYFSETGQRWGNPHYNWNFLKRTRFKWWKARLHSQLDLFDILRIDHFRGFAAAWEIPVTEATAINGQWVEAPGHALLKALKKEFGDIPLIAEDLGVITPEVEQLRADFKLPGMKILQFAFNGDAGNAYLPHNHEVNTVVYTGTHDNDTSLGWFNALNDNDKRAVYHYLGCSQIPMPDVLVGVAFSSVANLAIVPMQDILHLGSEHRMNIPGTVERNWQWQFSWPQLEAETAIRLANIVKMFGR